MSPSPLSSYHLTIVDYSTDAKVTKPTAIRPYDYWPLFRINLTLLPNLLPLNYITFDHSIASNVPKPTAIRSHGLLSLCRITCTKATAIISHVSLSLFLLLSLWDSKNLCCKLSSASVPFSFVVPQRPNLCCRTLLIQFLKN